MLAGVFRTIQIGLAVLCAYFIYGAVAPLVTAAALPEQRLPAVATADEASIALAEYGSIARRRLFRTREKPKAAVVAPTPQKLVESKIPWKLTATVASSNVPELSLATVMNERTRETRAVRINDKLVNATVERIERRRIVLNNSGKLETLSLEDDKDDKTRPGAQGTKARAAKAAKGRRARPNRTGANALRAANLRRARAEAAEKARQAREDALAQSATEQPEALEEATPDVAAVVPPGEQLRPNEQVISINGIPVDDPARMDELLETMNSGNTVMHVRDEDGNERDFVLEGSAP